jgi:hypothetical protein
MSVPEDRALPAGRVALVAAIAVAAMIAAELAMGRLILSKSGTLLLWVSQTDGPETSQQLFDWYSVTHVEHGLLFYGGVWLLGFLLPRMRCPDASFLAVLAIEAAWEVLENSPIIIDRYRAQTAAVGYTGDTLLNSLTDLACCMLGWLIARKLPPWGTVVLFVLVEIGLALAIRDNFALNVLMLAWPVQAIKRWQQGV